jgi:hypothetical protein
MLLLRRNSCGADVRDCGHCIMAGSEVSRRKYGIGVVYSESIIGTLPKTLITKGFKSEVVMFHGMLVLRFNK